MRLVNERLFSSVQPGEPGRESVLLLALSSACDRRLLVGCASAADFRVFAFSLVRLANIYLAILRVILRPAVSQKQSVVS